ncbi:hypothetical protein A5747_23690 [Mycobacterium sp. IS-836]|nr:DUF5631 domain-containing protein [Mycobacterium sp. IS-836]OMC50929.1 hypothetical protein A5747_23690 [Mycobacterium sp. IS-836]
MAIFGRIAARQRLRRATRESLEIPAFSSQIDCTPWVTGGLWPAELSTITGETAALADYLRADLQRITRTANDELKVIKRADMTDSAREAEEARVIDEARAHAQRRVESTLRHVRAMRAEMLAGHRRPQVRQRVTRRDIHETQVIPAVRDVEPAVAAPSDAAPAPAEPAEGDRHEAPTAPPVATAPPADDRDEPQVSAARHRAPDDDDAVTTVVAPESTTEEAPDVTEAEQATETEAAESAEAEKTEEAAEAAEAEVAVEREDATQVMEAIAPEAPEPEATAPEAREAETAELQIVEPGSVEPDVASLAEELEAPREAEPVQAETAKLPIAEPEPVEAQTAELPIVEPEPAEAEPAEPEPPAAVEAPATVETPEAPEPPQAPAAVEAPAVAESDDERLQRLLAFVVHQEPQLNWAVGDLADGTTLLVTDLAHGWIPSGITLPAGVRLLEPRRRRGKVSALLDEATRMATYTPGDFIGRSDDVAATEPSVQPRELPPVDDLGWELGRATHWRDGLPRLVHTLAKAAAAGTGVVEEEVDLLRVHLDTARYQLLGQYPDIAPALLLNCLLLAATESLVARDAVSANYHFAWFQKLDAPPASQWTTKP